MWIDFGWVTPWYFVSSGMALLAGLTFLLLSFILPKKQQTGALFLLCVLVGSYQALVAIQQLEPDLTLTLFYEKCLVSLGVIFPVCLYLLFSSFIKPKHFQNILAFYACITATLFILNWMLPHGLVYQDITHIQTLTLAHETLYIHAGDSSHLWSYIWFAFLSATFVFCAFWSVKIYRFESRLTGSLLFIYLLIQFYTVVLTRLGRAQNEATLNIAGFGFIALLLIMCFAIVIAFKKSNQALVEKTRSLTREAQKRLKAESEQYKLIQIVDQDPMATLVLSLQGKVQSSNPASLSFWGEDLTKRDINLLDEIKKLCAANQQTIEFAETEIQLDPLKVTSGFKSLFESIKCATWLKVYLFSMYDQNGLPIGYCMRAKDVTHEQFIEKTLKQIAQGVSIKGRTNIFEQLVISLNEIFNSKYALIGLFNEKRDSVTTIACAENGSIIDNFSYQLTGTPCEKVVGNRVCCFTEQIQRKFPNDQLLKDLAIEGYIGTSIFNGDTPVGILAVLNQRPLAINPRSAEVLEIFASRIMVEVNKNQVESDIRKMAYHDYLTNLPNRAAFLAELSRLVDKADAVNQQALLLVDLDNFKYLNDSLGNDIADEILRAVGDKLSQFNDQGLIARYGGDEFVVVTDFQPERVHYDISEFAVNLANQIILALSEPIQIGERIVNAQASIGICLFPKHATNRLDILRFAETALIQAKEAGRNQCQLFSPSIQKKIDKRVEIEAELSYAIDKDELSLYFQPQVDRQGLCYGAEVLLRWHNEKFGFVSPATFIPIAEESGLIHSIGDWVLSQSIDMLHVWRQQYPDLQLSVNVSAWQFSDPEFVKKVKGILSAYQVLPTQLTLELTETGLLQNIEQTRQKLSDLRLLGFKIALDDFGTGYSSLSYLRDLPLDEIKIDKAFVDEVDGHTPQPLIESMIAIAKHMGLHVIAEGVETIEQKQALSAMGCVNYQGYLFAKPMESEAFLAWLKVTSAEYAIAE